jgi:hypothetical protein
MRQKRRKEISDDQQNHQNQQVESDSGYGQRRTAHDGQRCRTGRTVASSKAASKKVTSQKKKAAQAAKRPWATQPNQLNQPRQPRPANLARSGNRRTRQRLLRIPVRRSPKVKARNCWPSSVASSGPTGRQIADDRGQRRLRFGERVAASRFTNLYARMAKILECSCNQEFPCSNAVENFGEE